MLGDCIVPSNVREGYLARLVIRRTLRMMNDFKMQDSLADIHRRTDEDHRDGQVPAGHYHRARDCRPRSGQVRRHSNGTRIVQKVAKTYKAKSERVPLSEIVTLYDSHGIPPEMIKDIAAKEGAVIDLPDNFYSQIADMHSESKKEGLWTQRHVRRARARTGTAAPRNLYEQPEIEFEAVCSISSRLRASSIRPFYPEGGGQPADTGSLVAESMARVDK